MIYHFSTATRLLNYIFQFYFSVAKRTDWKHFVALQQLANKGKFLRPWRHIVFALRIERV